MQGLPVTQPGTIDPTGLYLAIIRNPAGDILLGRRNVTGSRCFGCWTLPGGRPEPADTSPEQTIAREVQEETGLRLTFSPADRSDILRWKNRSVYVYIGNSGENVPCDTPELIDLQFFPPFACAGQLAAFPDPGGRALAYYLRKKHPQVIEQHERCHQMQKAIVTTAHGFHNRRPVGFSLPPS